MNEFEFFECLCVKDDFSTYIAYTDHTMQEKLFHRTVDVKARRVSSEHYSVDLTVSERKLLDEHYTVDHIIEDGVDILSEVVRDEGTERATRTFQHSSYGLSIYRADFALMD